MSGQHFEEAGAGVLGDGHRILVGQARRRGGLAAGVGQPLGQPLDGAAHDRGDVEAGRQLFGAPARA